MEHNALALKAVLERAKYIGIDASGEVDPGDVYESLRDWIETLATEESHSAHVVLRDPSAIVTVVY